MGNSRSQPNQRSRSMYLFYLIHRTWNGKEDHQEDKEDRDEEIDREIDAISSSTRCSGCRSCGYRQNSLTFDSESEMAPNAEEELLAVKPWGPQPEKERLRPPTYNAEDYANALRRWGRRPIVSSQDSQGTLPSTTSSSSGYASGCGEMTLRQFTSVSELLNKLRADLRLAFPSFVQEFASAPADGITLLLETLRGVQLIQSSPPSGQGGPRMGTRRAALDELGCVECLAACGERCADAPRLLSQAQPGLLALAVCLTSSLNRSRVLALQLLTKVCQAPGGHSAVSEAVSTLRLKYGEGGRFRFLAGALLAPRAAIALRVAGISFLNAFLNSAPRTQTRLYIQAEACEAGLEPKILQKWVTEIDGRGEDPLNDLLHKEVLKWSHNCVDVDALQKRLARAEETCAILGNKVNVLQSQLEKCQMENINNYNREERKGTSNINIPNAQRILSSNAEDEGISSSERSSSPEDIGRSLRKNDCKIGSIDNDQETTIDDVIEELRIIVKDAEEEFEDRNEQRTNFQEDSKDSRSCASGKRSLGKESKETRENICPTTRIIVDRQTINNQITYFGSKEEESSIDSDVTRKLSSTSSGIIGKTSNDASLKIVVKNSDIEDAIIPAILYPQPPRRSPPCLSTILATRQTDFIDHRVICHSHDEEEEDAEEETLGDGSDSLLSASRMKYNTKNDSSQPISSNFTSQFYRDKKNDDETRNNRKDVEKRQLKTIRNFDGRIDVSKIDDSDETMKYLEVYKEFETVDKINAFSSMTRKRETKFKNDSDKRKFLGRSQSQDLLGSSASSLQSGKSSNNRIESRIRKFESLNTCENSSLQHFPRVEDTNELKNNCKALKNCSAKFKMQRSESFHQVSHAAINDSRLIRGSSDSGLLCVTDYDLESLKMNSSINKDIFSSYSQNLLTKSLDRIDESHDFSIDSQTIRSTKEKQRTTNSNSRNEEKKMVKNKSLLLKCRKLTTDKNLKNEERSSASSLISNGNFNEKSTEKSTENSKGKSKGNSSGISTVNSIGNSTGNAKQLRNDEFYEDEKHFRQWNFKNDFEVFGKLDKFSSNRNSIAIMSLNGSRHESFNYERSGNKFSTNDSGVFLPSGRYDVFGLGKNRFNAGKYSGNVVQKQNQDQIGIRRNSGAALVANRGKVTDILSGLY